MPEPAADDVVIVGAGWERIDDLQTLWESLHRHHTATAPQLQTIGRERLPSESWRVRRQHYRPNCSTRPTRSCSSPSWVDLPSATRLFTCTARRRRRTPVRRRLETLAVLEGHRGRRSGAGWWKPSSTSGSRSGLRSGGVGDPVELRTRSAFRATAGQPYLVTYIGTVPETGDARARGHSARPRGSRDAPDCSNPSRRVASYGCVAEHSHHGDRGWGAGRVLGERWERQPARGKRGWVGE